MATNTPIDVTNNKSTVAVAADHLPEARSKDDTHVRRAMRDYWHEHTGEATVQAMMLDSKAEILDKAERPEILSHMPKLDNITMLELGAGSGRFTPTFAERVKSVLAIDFIETSIKKNEEVNGPLYNNIDFKCADVTTLEFPQDRQFNLVFSNWLLMYLSDFEVERFAKKALQWVTPNGHLYFRESCFHPSGDRSRSSNPTQYRDPSWYEATFGAARVAGPDGQQYKFEIERSGKVESYVELKQNKNQRWWLWRKVAVKKQ